MQVSTIEKLAETIFEKHNQVYLVDIHTAYGITSKLSLYCCINLLIQLPLSMTTFNKEMKEASVIS